MLVEAGRRHDAAQDSVTDIATADAQALAGRLGRAIGSGFRVIRELGGGGMSRLFLAEELAQNRLVVVKVLAAPDGANAERLRQEAALTAMLRHPHVLPVLAAGEREGLAFFVTPWMAGGTLRDRLRPGAPLAIAEARRILRELATALAHVHAQGVVHGDLKPENVLMQHGRAVLADFGAARLARLAVSTRDRAPGLAQGPAVGTPLYMSPEQAAGDPHLDPRSDVYSFGVLAFELLTGRPPFAGPTPRAVLLAHLGEPVPCLLRLRPDLPLDLVTIIARALAKDPAERYADGAALLAALDRARRPAPFRHATLFGSRAATATTTEAWRARAASLAGTIAAATGGIGLSALGLAAAAMMMMQVAPADDRAMTTAAPLAADAMVHETVVTATGTTHAAADEWATTDATTTGPDADVGQYDVGVTDVALGNALAALQPSSVLTMPGVVIAALPPVPTELSPENPHAAAAGCPEARKVKGERKAV